MNSLQKHLFLSVQIAFGREDIIMLFWNSVWLWFGFWGFLILGVCYKN